ncbi:MAG: GH36 C-terminal domain-containing protein, partial [Lachnospiraceae bacterium]|nr:GH36 C-terminal domain-containing protein [Lachnospiraceae bacterium]
NYKSRRLFFKGLDEDMVYEFAEGYDGASPLHGATLMNAGINIEPIPGDIQARLIYIKSVSGGLFKGILTELMGA